MRLVTCMARTVYICGFSMACCWKPFMSEKERLKPGAAMSPWGELAYMGCGGGEPAGKELDSVVRATCIVAAQC